MCKCQDENNKPCSTWKKWALVWIGVIVLAGIGYWYFKIKRPTV